MWKYLLFSIIMNICKTFITFHLGVFITSSVQFSCSVVSNSLRPHESQDNRPPCPSPTPGVHLNSCRLIGDTIQPSHPLLSPSPPAFNLSQHQGLFKWVSSSHQVTKALESHFQHQSFQWIFRTDFLYDWLVGSPCCPRGQSKTFCTTRRVRYNWRYNFHWT